MPRAYPACGTSRDWPRCRASWALDQWQSGVRLHKGNAARPIRHIGNNGTEAEIIGITQREAQESENDVEIAGQALRKDANQNIDHTGHHAGVVHNLGKRILARL